MSDYRVRFAPSPTGYLHIGGARTALYNWLLAKRFGGKFILRIEDTDLERSTEESLKMVVSDLQWLGLNWDEGPAPQSLQDIGSFGPYRQSQRTPIYLKHAEELVVRGAAYYDFRTDEELEAEKKAAGEGFRQIERPNPIIAADEARRRLALGERAAIRFKNNDAREYVLQDLIRGEVRFPSDMVGDFVILRSNGMPVYNFCCVVDDHLMQISHVFRAEEHLSNTVRQMMLYEAFGWALPEFGHLSIILDENKQKMSKRRGATSCHEFKEHGYLPEAIKNFILLLGWSPPGGEEVISEAEVIRQFTDARFNASPAVFDEQKLNWMNSVYLRALPHQELWRRLTPFLLAAGLEVSADAAWIDRALSVFKTSVHTLRELVPLFTLLDDGKFVLDPSADEILKWPESRQVWCAWQNEIGNFSGEYLSEADFNAIQERIKNSCGVKGKHLFQPVRVAVIGKPQGSELQILVPLLKKASLLRRVELCLSRV